MSINLRTEFSLTPINKTLSLIKMEITRFITGKCLADLLISFHICLAPLQTALALGIFTRSCTNETDACSDSKLREDVYYICCNSNLCNGIVNAAWKEEAIFKTIVLFSALSVLVQQMLI